MQGLVTLLCVCFTFLPITVGVGITLFLERHIGMWAYLVGLLMPIITLALVFIAYEVWTRGQICSTADNPANTCGAPLGLALGVYVGSLCLIVIANALAQAAVMFFIRTRRRAEFLRQQEGYQEQEPTGFASFSEQISE